MYQEVLKGCWLLETNLKVNEQDEVDEYVNVTRAWWFDDSDEENNLAFIQGFEPENT